MLTKQQKIDAIYNKIANKELSFGCRILFKNQDFHYYENFPEEYTREEEIPCDMYTIYIRRNKFYIYNIKVHDVENPNVDIPNFKYSDEFSFKEFDEDNISDNEDGLYIPKKGDKSHIEIIGHPVMIGDVMEYLNLEVFPIVIQQAYYGCNEDAEIINLWKEKRLPIEDQSDECIDFIYNLISK